MIVYTNCPSCGGNHITKGDTVIDFSITGESFPLMKCDDCGLIFTDHVPEHREIGRYYEAEEYISHSDTDTGIINRLYHLVRKRTLRKKMQLVKRDSGKDHGSILDIGSGTGAFLATMKGAGWDATGIEPDVTARQNSEKLHNMTPLSPDGITSIPDASFDVITMWHVLEHVHDLDDQMKQLRRLLKDDGRIFIAVPNHQSYDSRHYGRFWAAWDVPRHLYHFSPVSMKHLADRYGFRIISMKPMWFDSFYVSMLSEQYKRGKPALPAAVVTGAISNLRAIFDKKKCSSLIYVIRKAGEGMAS